MKDFEFIDCHLGTGLRRFSAELGLPRQAPIQQKKGKKD